MADDNSGFILDTANPQMLISYLVKTDPTMVVVKAFNKHPTDKELLEYINESEKREDFGGWTDNAWVMSLKLNEYINKI